MAYLKGTKTQCEYYNDKVFENEFDKNGITKKFADIIEIKGYFYIEKHPKHGHNNMIVVDCLPALNKNPNT